MSASSELIFNIFSALAEFERRLIQERTRAGLSAALSRSTASVDPTSEVC
jgi:DNA invertase Pin-like site-specific DNA recombinase